MKKNLNPLYEYLLYLDVSNPGGWIGAGVGAITPYMISKLYNKLITSEKITNEMTNYLNSLNAKQLNNEILWVVNTYTKLLKNGNAINGLVNKVMPVVSVGKKILMDKSTNDTVKIQYLYDVVRKHKLVTRFSHKLFCKYNSSASGMSTLMFLLTCLTTSLGSLGGAELYRNM